MKLHKFIAITLILFISVISYGSYRNINAESEMTVREFIQLSGYSFRNYDKVNLGTIKELLEETDEGIIKVQAEIFRNEDRKEFQGLSFEELEPISPDETIEIGNYNLEHINLDYIDEEQSFYFYYLLEEKSSLPGYKFHSKLHNTISRKEIIVPEKEKNYSWAYSWYYEKGLKEIQKTNETVPFLFRKGIIDDESGTSFPGIRSDIDMGKQAHLFNIFVVFSYKIIEK